MYSRTLAGQETKYYLFFVTGTFTSICTVNRRSHNQIDLSIDVKNESFV